jgi:paraquat-inducible protein B
MSGTGFPNAPEARVHQRRFSFVWLIPIVAAVIATFLAYRTLSQRGPLITIDFSTGDGLTAGLTQLKHKAVPLGTVESIRLSENGSRVVAQVRTQREAERELTDHARFWVVRPRLSLSSISGLDTLVSGTYIELDPGTPGGEAKRDFVGLDEPPGIRSDEPGRTFRLAATRIGSLGPQSPVFYRDVQVGEVLGFDPPGLDGNVIIHVFVRSPYDQNVRTDSRFWSASGLNVRIGGEGLHVELASLMAVLSGGVTFDTPPFARAEPPAASETEFALYPDSEAAASATSKQRINILVYFEGSVRGLRVGSPVELDGIRIGSVTDVRLEYEPDTESYRVPVHLEVEPERVIHGGGRSPQQVLELAHDLAARGMRAQLQLSSLLTGQLVVAFEVFPNAVPADIRVEGGEIVFPAQPGGPDSLTKSLDEIAAKLNRLPLDQIGQTLDQTLASVHGIVSSPDLKETVQRFPQLSAELAQTIRRLNRMLVSVDSGYGQDSNIRRDLERLVSQANETARSVRELSDFLDRHPEALLRGRSGEPRGR